MSNDIKKTMWKAMSDSPKVMVSLVGEDMHAEPMYAQLDKDADSEFWFYTSRENRIAKGGKAMVHFASKGHDVFACIRGNLTVESRKEVIDKYWSNPVEAWLLMLRFELIDAEVWDADPSLKGMFKMLTGKTVKPEEMGEHEKVEL